MNIYKGQTLFEELRIEASNFQGATPLALSFPWVLKLPLVTKNTTLATGSKHFLKPLAFR